MIFGFDPRLVMPIRREVGIDHSHMCMHKKKRIAIYPCATRTRPQFGFWLGARIDRALNFVARSDLVTIYSNRFQKRLSEFRGNLKAVCSVSDVDTNGDGEDGDLNPSPSTSLAFRSCDAESTNSHRLCKAVQLKHLARAR
jgi:hypothetical protein